MKVWILEYNTEKGGIELIELMGIYSSLDKANAEREDARQQHRYSYGILEVSEWEVDS